MQRLFSMFPTGRPGVALLLMRTALAIMLLEGVASRLLHLGSLWYFAAPALVAVALGLGFLTPVVATLTVLLELAALLTWNGPVEAVHVCAVINAIALGLLGPGAYSLDARLFGRRQIVVRSRDGEADK